MTKSTTPPALLRSVLCDGEVVWCGLTPIESAGAPTYQVAVLVGGKWRKTPEEALADAKRKPRARKARKR